MNLLHHFKDDEQFFIFIFCDKYILSFKSHFHDYILCYVAYAKPQISQFVPYQRVVRMYFSVFWLKEEHIHLHTELK